MVNGIRFLPFLYAGIGTGIDDLSFDGIHTIAIPLYVNVKGYLSVSAATSLFLSFDGDASFLLNNDNSQSGVLLSPAIGAQFKLHADKALNVALFYNTRGVGYSKNMNAIGLNLGFVF